MKLYLTRHGQTNYNILGLCNDDPERDVHLTPLGIRQAEQAAAKLKEAPIERIIVSELPRTRQTAEIINRHHNVPIAVHPAINDIRSGFDGKPVIDYFQATAHDPLHASANGGESLLEHKQRVMGFIEWLKQQDDGSLLVIAHEETLRVFVAWFQQLPDEALRTLQFGNCEILEYYL